MILKYITYFFPYGHMDGQEIYLKIFLKKDQNKYENYCFTVPGYNVRPTNLNAAIGIEQLKKLKNLSILEEKITNFLIKFLKMMIDLFSKV